MGADIVIAVDLQHDAHLMQQDLMPVNLQSEDAEGEKLARHERLRGRLGRMAARRAVTAPTAIEIMTTSIQVWRTASSATAWLATRRIFCFSRIVRKFLPLISIGLRPPSQRAR